LVAELRHKIHTAAVADEFGDRRIGIAKIAEVTRPDWTGRNAGGDAIALRQLLLVDAIDTERAFFHCSRARIEFTRPVWTCPTAQLAADAFVLVN